jgi:hypothetical protein
VDLAKIILFIVVFAALLVLGRILSSSSEVHASTMSPGRPGEGPAEPASGDDDQLSEGNRHHPLTGAEFGFPFRVPPVTRLEDGTYNRPNFVDYYFSKIDLSRGPDDPECFFDELCLKAQDPGNGHNWDTYYTVATPSGLRKVMEDERFASLYLDGGAIIVPRWDLANILHTVVDELMKDYGHKQHEAGPHDPEMPQSS